MPDYSDIVDFRTVRTDLLLPGPIEQIWGYLTEPGLLASWLAQGQIELREGGQVELTFDVEEVPERKKAGAMVRGVVSRCDPPRLLEYSWIDASPERARAENPVPDSMVSFELQSKDRETRLIVTHRRLPTAMVAGCAAGWHTHLGNLRARLSGEALKPFLSTWRKLLPTYEYRLANVLATGQAED